MATKSWRRRRWSVKRTAASARWPTCWHLNEEKFDLICWVDLESRNDRCNDGSRMARVWLWLDNRVLVRCGQKRLELNNIWMLPTFSKMNLFLNSLSISRVSCFIFSRSSAWFDVWRFFFFANRCQALPRVSMTNSSKSSTYFTPTQSIRLFGLYFFEFRESAKHF